MTLRSSIIDFQEQTGITLLDDIQNTDNDVTLARRILERLNKYFYVTDDRNGIGTLDGREYKYLPDFHKYWESHHAEIINAKINREQARVAARALHSALVQYGESIFDVTLNTRGLSRQAIAQVRFFTANQDFREPPEDQFGKYLEDNTQFDAQNIYDDPADFLRFLGLSRLSQNDKRLDYARHAAEFLLEKGITAFQIAEYFGDDAKRIREGFLESVGMGYGRKKTDMFLRDMAVLGVWPNLSNKDVIDVAS